MSSEDRAQRLKLQGNALHEQGEYQAAHEKFSEAIKEDPENPVFYANRSATSLAMNEFLDAAYDAEKATNLDPKYAKAWARLANATQCLNLWDKCFDAWQSALACIPAQDATAAQTSLQAKFREGLKLSKAAKAHPPPAQPSRLVAVPVGRGKTQMPWVRAAALEKEILATQEQSSAIIILYSSRTFEKGVQSMKSTVKRYIKGELAIEGVPNAIEAMTNGILIDRRCFYMDKDWGKQYIEQVKFEGEYYQAWGKGGAKVVCEQAPGRLKKEGWASVGPAICMTVRLWIMQGFLSGSTGDQRVAAEYFRSSLDVIEWGRETWLKAGIKREQCGDIFDVTFMRSVNRLFIAAVMDWLEMDDPQCTYTLQDLAKFAQDMIKELKHNTPEKIQEHRYHPNHLGYYAAGWIYPHADALGALGWFHLRLCTKSLEDDDKKIHLTAAARCYMEAADTYPPDDEFSVFFRSIALDALQQHGTPLRQTLPICKQIRLALPAAHRIWEHSAMAKRRDLALLEVLEWERECHTRLFAKRLTLSSKVGSRHV